MKEIKYPIVTERLYLSPYKLDFTDDLYELKQLPQTHRFNYSKVPTRDEISKSIHDFVNYDYQNPKGRFELGILLKETEKYIGYVGLKGNKFEKDSTAEIYYTIHPDYFVSAKKQPPSHSEGIIISAVRFQGNKASSFFDVSAYSILSNK